jgi:hypothetical protein
VRTLASYGRKAIPFIQELRNTETDEDMKNYMFDTITQIEREIYRLCVSKNRLYQDDFLQLCVCHLTRNSVQTL